MIEELKEILNYKGKTVVVTGAAKGMGIGIARRFAQAGADVAITYMSNGVNAEKLVEELKDMGSNAMAFQMDQSKPADCERTMKQIFDVYSRIDVLINNAGININRNTMDITEEVWDKVLDTNTKGNFFCSREAARYMIQNQTAGSIVNIASINGFTPLADGAHYGASKAGIIMGTRSLAADFGKYKIRVNAIAPGLMDAPGLDEAVPGWRESYVSRAPLGRIGKWEDIGNICLFLSSPLADWITGQTIVADGGVTLAPAY